MQGDFSRGFQTNHANDSRVLLLQGRPLSEADWNTQVDLLLREQRKLAELLIGWHGSSLNGDNFCLSLGDSGLVLSPGSYYVDGLHCVNREEQKRDLGTLTKAKLHLAVLTVWEQSISLERQRSLLDPAINLHATSARAEVVWAIRIFETSGDETALKAIVQSRAATATLVENRILFDKQRHRIASAVLELKDAAVSAKSIDSACEALIEVGNQPGSHDIVRFEILSVATSKNDQQFTDKIDVVWANSNDIARFRVLVQDAIPPKTNLSQITVEAPDASVSADSLRGKWVSISDAVGDPISRHLGKIKGVSPQAGGKAWVIQFDEDIPTLDQPSMKPSPLFSNWTYRKKNDLPLYEVRIWDGQATFSVTYADQEPKAWSVDSQSAPNALKAALGGKEPKFSGYAANGLYWLVPLRFGIPWVAKDQPIPAEGARHHAPIAIVKEESTSAATAPAPPAPALPASPAPTPTAPPPATPAAHAAAGTAGSSGKWVLVPAKCVEAEWARFKPLGAFDGEPIERPPQPATDASAPSGTPVPAPPAPGTPAPAPPAPAPPAPGTPAPAPPAAPGTPSPEAMLSPSGQEALRSVLASPLDLARHLPARWLNFTPRSDSYRRFRAPLLLLDILKPSFESYFAEYERCARPTDDERELARDDAARDYELACGCRKMLAEGGVRSLIG